MDPIDPDRSRMKAISVQLLADVASFMGVGAVCRGPGAPVHSPI